MHHKNGHQVYVLSRAFLVTRESDGKPIHLVGTHVDITERKKAAAYDKKNSGILEMIAIRRPASEIYDAIALMYEDRRQVCDAQCSNYKIISFCTEVRHVCRKNVVSGARSGKRTQCWFVWNIHIYRKACSC